MRMSIPGFLGQEVFRGTRPQAVVCFSPMPRLHAVFRGERRRRQEAGDAQLLCRSRGRPSESDREKTGFFPPHPSEGQVQSSRDPAKETEPRMHLCMLETCERSDGLPQLPQAEGLQSAATFGLLPSTHSPFAFIRLRSSPQVPSFASHRLASRCICICSGESSRCVWRRLSTDSLPRILCFGLYSGKMDANSGPLLLSLVAFLDSLGLRKAAKALRKDSTAQGLLTGEEAELFPGATLAQVVKRGLREKKRHREREGEAAEETQAAAESSEKKKKKVALAGSADAPEAAGEREKKQKKNRFEGKTKQRAQREETPSADSEEAAETTAEVNETENGETDAFAKKAEKGQKNEHASVLRRFKRVDESKWVEKIKKEDLKDNSFWNKKDDSFAVKAAHDLGKVRGRDFRHEKTKKKRASWKGCGEIPMTVNSIQFDSSDDE
ncbi:SRP40, C-terminal domain-containing protein [Toxoplasma gondii ARI]|uniref:SRP40, C-terminal domain-containing protein n=3 Tax=Toxoplasma gondii TaxID=5811 RepID=A0A139XR15_TOXGO|nr:SRP40, C-terminal domain-containing protein [Toxoplasma gondii ARI]